MKRVWELTLYDILTDPSLVPAMLREGEATLINLQMTAEDLLKVYPLIKWGIARGEEKTANGTE